MSSTISTIEVACPIANIVKDPSTQPPINVENDTSITKSKSPVSTPKENDNTTESDPEPVSSAESTTNESLPKEVLSFRDAHPKEVLSLRQNKLRVYQYMQQCNFVLGKTCEIFTSFSMTTDETIEIPALKKFKAKNQDDVDVDDNNDDDDDDRDENHGDAADTTSSSSSCVSKDTNSFVAVEDTTRTKGQPRRMNKKNKKSSNKKSTPGMQAASELNQKMFTFAQPGIQHDSDSNLKKLADLSSPDGRRESGLAILRYALFNILSKQTDFYRKTGRYEASILPVFSKLALRRARQSISHLLQIDSIPVSMLLLHADAVTMPNAQNVFMTGVTTDQQRDYLEHLIKNQMYDIITFLFTIGIKQKLWRISLDGDLLTRFHQLNVPNTLLASITGEKYISKAQLAELVGKNKSLADAIRRASAAAKIESEDSAAMSEKYITNYVWGTWASQVSKAVAALSALTSAIFPKAKVEKDENGKDIPLKDGETPIPDSAECPFFRYILPDLMNMLDKDDVISSWVDRPVASPDTLMDNPWWCRCSALPDGVSSDSYLTIWNNMISTFSKEK